MVGELREGVEAVILRRPNYAETAFWPAFAWAAGVFSVVLAGFLAVGLYSGWELWPVHEMKPCSDGEILVGNVAGQFECRKP